MRSLRKQIKAAVLAALPALTSGCPAPQRVADAGSLDAGSGSASTGGGGTGSTAGNLCSDCVAQGQECNLYATGCQAPCTDCACEQIVEPVDALDGGYPDGGLSLALCRAVCPDPIGNVWSCGVVDGGCTPSSLGTLCIHCLAESCPGVGGRCPEGLRAPVVGAVDAAAAFLVRSAHLEAASVHAFQRMSSELRSFGAPQALHRRAQEAARDEVRHARSLGRLAVQRGGRLAEVEIPPFQLRDLRAFAVENAVEGTVRETLGAALALWQSLRAEDVQLRSAMTSIFEDEARHAALAWDVEAWAFPRLSIEARLEVREARRGAAVGWSAAPMVAETNARLGLPTPGELRELVEELTGRVWIDGMRYRLKDG